MRLRLSCLVLAILAGCERPGPVGEALLVTVHFDEGLNTHCALVRVATEEGEVLGSTKPIARADRLTLEVGVFRDSLPSTVRVDAEGFLDEACTVPSVPPERSESKLATFAQGVVAVSLHVSKPQVVDAGVDAGIDAGVRDAGVPDAGIDAGTELCDNHVDDDGDSFIDCNDPSCPTATSCDDFDACTTGERCSAGRCVGGMRSCLGQTAACYKLVGCDAGVCLAAPAGAREPCDGGRCDGNGRCAPFCDALNMALRACFQFEGVLTDGSGNGNVAMGASTFDAGVHGLGWVSERDAGLSIGDRTSLACSDEVTLEAWVFLTSMPATGARFGVIDNDGKYGMFIGPGGELRCSAGGAINVPSVLRTGAWLHLACVRGGGSIRAYVDGQEKGAAAATGALNTAAGNGLCVGQNSPSGDVLPGLMDGVRVWCTARGQADLCASPTECG